jgi:hypothetical protein
MEELTQCQTRIYERQIILQFMQNTKMVRVSCGMLVGIYQG